MDGGVGSTCGKSIMMRFRPIAPKPVAGGWSSVETSAKGRTKRKYVRVRRYNRKKKSNGKRTRVQVVGEGGGSEKNGREGEGEGEAVELWVTDECVTDECMEGELGGTDEERIKNLEEDTCPGFVSDGMNRVEWLNEAFKRMVRQRSNDREGEIRVRLIISNPKLGNLRRVFTCQIKLHFRTGTDMDKDSKLVPCDAWRMDGGGFAWKLDVKAALTLAPLLQEDF